MPLATWTGPFDTFLPNLTTLRVGDQHDVSDRDLESAHWTPVAQPAAPPPPPTLPAPSTPTSSSSTGGDS